MTKYVELYNYILGLRYHIHDCLKVAPKLYIYMTKENSIGGRCDVHRKIQDTQILLFLPHNINFSKSKNQLTMVLLHEYSHYLRALNQTQSERSEDIQRYNYDTQHRHYDERQTWIYTEKLARELGLWTPSFARSFALTKNFVGKP